MPLYNSEQNNIYAALEQAYKEMMREEPQRVKQPDEDAGRHIGQRNAGGAFAGGPQGGIGKDKDAKNKPEEDDKRAKKQKDQAQKDRKADAKDRAAGVDQDEGKGKGEGVEAAEKKAQFKPHEGPYKVKKIRRAGPRTRR